MRILYVYDGGHHRPTYNLPFSENILGFFVGYAIVATSSLAEESKERERERDVDVRSTTEAGV